MNDSVWRRANAIFANQYGIPGLLGGLITPNYRSKNCLVFFSSLLVRLDFFFPHFFRLPG